MNRSALLDRNPPALRFHRGALRHGDAQCADPMHGANRGQIGVGRQLQGPAEAVVHVLRELVVPPAFFPLRPPLPGYDQPITLDLEPGLVLGDPGQLDGDLIGVAGGGGFRTRREELRHPFAARRQRDAHLVEAAEKVGDVIAAAISGGIAPRARSGVLLCAVELAVGRLHPKPGQRVISRKRTSARKRFRKQRGECP